MPDDFSSHGDYMRAVGGRAAERRQAIEQALRQAFGEFIQSQQVEVIVFSAMTAVRLGEILLKSPEVLKPVLACTSIAARAIERDLGIKNLDTYRPRLSETTAMAIAGYIKPFLPDYIELPSLSCIDRLWFIDKEVRKSKGQWERRVRDALNRYGSTQFGKRMFEVGGEAFELDAATPIEGPVQIGIDIKRIEARRDIHKRCDEIVNKANKLRSAFPTARFAAILYYPFVDEYVNVKSRLNLKHVVFAADSEESVNSAAQLLLDSMKDEADAG